MHTLANCVKLNGNVVTPQQDEFDATELLQTLLDVTPPVTKPTLRRPAQLRSLQQERKTALAGYRFRTFLDPVLWYAERILFVLLIGFFGYWLYDGYGRDWWHQRQQAPTAVVAWEQIQPGASAAEIDRMLGKQLPVVAPNIPVPLAQSPDYLAPAHEFVLLPPTPTPTPNPLDIIPVHIVVPVMQLDSPVKEVYLREGTWEVADYAVGYHHGTAIPGTGNTVLAGHAGFRGGVFARLNELSVGDDIYLDTNTTRFHYQVSAIRNVWPDQVEVMYPTAETQITMITCTAWDTQRLVVIAQLVDQAPRS